MYKGSKIKASEIIEEEIHKIQREMGIIMNTDDIELLRKMVSPSTKILQSEIKNV